MSILSLFGKKTIIEQEIDIMKNALENLDCMLSASSDIMKDSLIDNKEQIETKTLEEK